MNGSWPFVEVFNASTGEKVADIRSLTREPTWDGSLTCMGMSPDGSALFCVSQEKLMSVVNTTSYQKIASFDVSQRDYTYGKPDHIYFSEDSSKAYLIYWGSVRIDSPGPDSPSIIGVMDTRSYEFTKIITLDQHAGAGQMAIRAP